jgi:DNA-binding NarL/FixJ family response regulator
VYYVLLISIVGPPLRGEGDVIVTEGQLRVLLADEQSLFREAVKVVLSSEGDLEVVAEARDGVQAVGEAERTQPDVALLDANLPNCDGIRATQLILARVPACRVIVFSGQEDERVLLEAMEAGASGYLSKEAPLAELIEATRAVHRGEAIVPPRMLGALLQRVIHRRRERDEAIKRMTNLTRREREVLAMLAQGADNDMIAQHLVISPETARTHVQNVLGKLRVHSRLEAAAFVTQNGILDDLVPAER